VTNGVQASAGMPRFSKDGSRMAFRSAVKSVNPVAIPFDPVTLRAGVPAVLDASNNIRIPSDLSPDGKQLAFLSIGERQEDVFIGGADGKGIRRVTDDAARDRDPMFTRDGKSLVFYSNRDGRAPWSVHADGGNMRKIVVLPEPCIFVLPSPVDDTAVCSSVAVDNNIYVFPLNADPKIPAVRLPNVKTPTGSLSATAFSPDGTRLTGILEGGTGRPTGVAVYDLRARTIATITDDETFGVRWLDNRRVMYFIANSPQIVVVDTVTRQRTVVDARLPAPSIDDLFAIARDGRMIYYGAAHAEADIWIAARKE
jgi:Tol biopolymer transport system component